MEPRPGLHSLQNYEVDLETGRRLLDALDSADDDKATALDETTVTQSGVTNTAVAEAFAFPGMSPGDKLVALDSALKQVKPTSGPRIHRGPNPPTFGLQNNNDSRSVAENAGRNAGDFLKGVLFELAEGGFICTNNLANSQVPARFEKKCMLFSLLLGAVCLCR